MESSQWRILPVLDDHRSLQELYLRRLKRGLLLRYYAGALLCPSDQRLLDHVIYSAYCDCQRVEAGDAARRLLNEARSGIGLFGRTPSWPGGSSGWST